MEEQTQPIETQPSTDQPEVTVTKTATCSSLSGTSTLTYEVGTTEQDTFLRVVGNSAAGMFCKEWIPLSQITDLLANSATASRTLKPLYEGKSSNSAGFLLAVLKAEGLVQSEVKSSQTVEAKTSRKKAKGAKA